jgi:heat shock protein HtpX
MAITKRVLLFIITNVLVVATISIVMSLFGVKPYLTAYGLNYTSLAIICAIWGTAGAFISLFMSKTIAKRSMGMQMIDPQKANDQERALLDIVYGLAKKVGLTKMPEVGIYDSPELNAFATGPSKKDALVAVSSGLLQRMDRNEIEGVLGHEISHVTNGDMVTMTLIQGIVNAFALFLSRIIAYVISMGLMRGNSRDRGGMSFGLFYMLSIAFSIVFTFFGSIVVAAFSRWREYRADAGGAHLAGRDNMINALQVLKQYSEVQDQRAPSLAALKISQPPRLSVLFASHPPIDARIRRLQQGAE